MASGRNAGRTRRPASTITRGPSDKERWESFKQSVSEAHDDAVAWTSEKIEQGVELHQDAVDATSQAIEKGVEFAGEAKVKAEELAAEAKLKAEELAAEAKVKALEAKEDAIDLAAEAGMAIVKEEEQYGIIRRSMGALQVVGAVGEIVIGAAGAIAAPGAGTVVGVVVIAHGADTFVAGVKQVFGDEWESTVTGDHIQNIAMDMGASKDKAGYIAAGTEAAIGLTNVALHAKRGTSVLMGKLAKNYKERMIHKALMSADKATKGKLTPVAKKFADKALHPTEKAIIVSGTAKVVRRKAVKEFGSAIKGAIKKKAKGDLAKGASTGGGLPTADASEAVVEKVKGDMIRDASAAGSGETVPEKVKDDAVQQASSGQSQSEPKEGQST